jgi:hypothetical protein
MNRSLLILLVIFMSVGRCVVVAKDHPLVRLGTITVDDWKAQIFLRENTNSLTVLVMIDVKDTKHDPIACGRFDGWVLVSDGKALNPLPRNTKAFATEIHMSGGGDAYIDLDFEGPVSVSNIVAVVVSVDKKAHLLPLSAP